MLRERRAALCHQHLPPMIDRRGETFQPFGVSHLIPI